MSNRSVSTHEQHVSGRKISQKYESGKVMIGEESSSVCDDDLSHVDNYDPTA